MPGSDNCLYCYWLGKLESCLKQQEEFEKIPGIYRAWSSVIIECENLLNKYECTCKIH